jgi:DNA mismatch repair ATPase MutS
LHSHRIINHSNKTLYTQERQHTRLDDLEKRPNDEKYIELEIKDKSNYFENKSAKKYENEPISQYNDKFMEEIEAIDEIEFKIEINMMPNENYVKMMKEIESISRISMINNNLECILFFK